MYFPTCQQITTPNTPQIVSATILRTPTTSVASSSPNEVENVIEVKLLDKSPERETVYSDEHFNNTYRIASNTSPYTLTCHTTLSTGQLYYAIDSTTVEDGSTIGSLTGNLGSTSSMFDKMSQRGENELGTSVVVLFNENDVIGYGGDFLLRRFLR